MNGYNVFTLKSDGGYGGVVQRVFGGDEEAVAFAQKMLAAHPGIEVWCGERCVGRFDGEEGKSGAENERTGGVAPT